MNVTNKCPILYVISENQGNLWPWFGKRPFCIFEKLTLDSVSIEYWLTWVQHWSDSRYYTEQHTKENGVKGGGKEEGRKSSDLPIVHLFGFAVERDRSLLLVYCESKSLEMLSCWWQLGTMPGLRISGLFLCREFLKCGMKSWQLEVKEDPAVQIKKK